MAGLIRNRGLGLVLGGLSLAAQAMMTEPEAAAAIEQLLAEGSSPQQVVAALREDGREVPAATVLALRYAAAEYHRGLGIAGVCAADSGEAAMQVVAALGPLPGIAEDDLGQIRRTAETWASGGCASPILTEPPASFDSTQLPGGGGGVSPAS
jgi:hypothetical protein